MAFFIQKEDFSLMDVNGHSAGVGHGPVSQ
jgi:hypothetical protein